MPNYRIEKPQPNPVRHTVEFTIAEVTEALIDYAAKHDITVPEGQEHLWGLETEDRMRDQSVTLVIDVEVLSDE